MRPRPPASGKTTGPGRSPWVSWRLPAGPNRTHVASGQRYQPLLLTSCVAGQQRHHRSSCSGCFSRLAQRAIHPSQAVVTRRPRRPSACGQSCVLLPNIRRQHQPGRQSHPNVLLNTFSRRPTWESIPTPTPIGDTRARPLVLTPASQESGRHRLATFFQLRPFSCRRRRTPASRTASCSGRLNSRLDQC